MSYQRAFSITCTSPFLRFCTIFSVRGQGRSFLPQVKSVVIQIKFNCVQAGDALCAEQMDASTGVLCIVSEIGAKLFWKTRSAAFERTDRSVLKTPRRICIQQLVALARFCPRSWKIGLACKNFIDRGSYLPSTDCERDTAYTRSQSWERNGLDMIGDFLSGITTYFESTPKREKQRGAGR